MYARRDMNNEHNGAHLDQLRRRERRTRRGGDADGRHSGGSACPPRICIPDLSHVGTRVKRAIDKVDGADNACREDPLRLRKKKKVVRIRIWLVCARCFAFPLQNYARQTGLRRFLVFRHIDMQIFAGQCRCDEMKRGYREQSYPIYQF